MKSLLSAAFAAALLFANIAQADEAAPIELTAAQMDQITAGDLTLPNGKQVFVGFDNPAPGDFHPVFLHGRGGSEGPWEAHFNAGPITCADC
jgi:hypothetical protein